MISTTSLAKILHVTSAAILQRYSKYKKHLKKHTRKTNDRRYYDARAVAIMIKSLKLKKYYKLVSKKQVKDLRIENDRQAQSIKQLHRLLSQQQRLALNSQHQLALKQNEQNEKHTWSWKFFH